MTKRASKEDPSANPSAKPSPKRGFIRSVASLVTTYKRSSFPGLQYKTLFFETATACIKRLGSWTSKDLEFAAMLDRFFEPPVILTLEIPVSGQLDQAHGLLRAPRQVSLMGWDADGVETTDPHFGMLITGWDDATISVVGTAGLKLWVAAFN